MRPVPNHHFRFSARSVLPGPGSCGPLRSFTGRKSRIVACLKGLNAFAMQSAGLEASDYSTAKEFNAAGKRNQRDIERCRLAFSACLTLGATDEEIVWASHGRVLRLEALPDGDFMLSFDRESMQRHREVTAQLLECAAELARARKALTP